MCIRLSLLGAACVSLGLVGCGNSGPQVVQIDGLATRGGKPVPFLTLNFTPEQGRPSWGVTDADGKFDLKYTDQQQGGVVGKHKVFLAFRPRSPKEEDELARGIKRPHPEQRAILEKYGNADTSPLEVEIKHAGQKVELKLD